MFYKKTLKIGTRKSALALAQTKLVGDAIKQVFPEVKIEYIPMNTSGDKRLDISLQEIGGKGLFTKELEEALISGETDLAIHSAKDLPLSLDKNFKICSVLKRAAVNDILILKKDYTAENIFAKNIIKNLPDNFRIGTSSKRRREQILLLNKKLKIVPVRGNIFTRMSKISSDDIDGVILAKAGLDRLMADREYRGDCREILQNMEVFNIPQSLILPAPAQGILCAEYTDKNIEEMLKQIQDKFCDICFCAERKYLELIQADCHTGAGIYIDRGKGFIKAYFEGRYAKVQNIKDDDGIFQAIEDLAKELINS